MLPNPAVTRSKNRPYFQSFQSTSASSNVLNHLRARTRLTNLAVMIICSITALSVFINLTTYFTPNSTILDIDSTWKEISTKSQIDTGIPLSIETTIERDTRFTELNHLVMVPGHAIWIGSDIARVEEDGEWILENMQKGGSVKTYLEHIKKGVDVLKGDPHALLVFSGGATRKAPAPPMTESQSYLSIAQSMDLIQHTGLSDIGPNDPLPLNLRTTTEEFALDSYENLLFALARFHEVSSRWPKKITVVGYGMKRKRFEELHRHAIRFPLDRFEYIGIDDQGDTTEHYAGENKYGYQPFISSPSGCHPPLSTKRLFRNPYFKYHPYHTSTPELRGLLEWCPPFYVPDSAIPLDQVWKSVPVYEGSLPWSDFGQGTRWTREKD